MKTNTICIALIAAILVVFTAGTALADPDLLETKLTASDGTQYDSFGRDVSIDGDTAIVGAPLDDDAGTLSGSAYIFRRTNAAGEWTEIKKLTASDAAAGDQFGNFVAIDGDTVIVGAYNASAGSILYSGAAYVFRDTTGAGDWTEIKKLTASDAESGDEFGCSVAIDGDTVIVGAWDEDVPGYASGAAYIFTDTSAAGNWSSVAETKLQASDAAWDDEFGWSVSIDDGTAIVGARFNDDAGTHSGSAYIFQDTTGAGNWTEIKKLTASDAAAYDSFGVSVASGGDTVLVGAAGDDDAGPSSGSAYIFRDTSAAGDWSSFTETKLTAGDASTKDTFGQCVSIDDGAAIVGAHANDDAGYVSGSAYVYMFTTTVTIDIKPGSDPNSINLSSAGVVPVAILSSDTFDATTVDPDTVSLAGAAVKLVGKSGKFLAHVEDVNGDGLPDLVCQVLTVDFIIEPGASVAVLEAQTFGGISIRGEDTLRIIHD